MKIEWTEKHSIEVSEEQLKQMAKDMDEYAKPYGWNLVEHCLDEWMSEADDFKTHTHEVVDFDKIVDKWTKIVKGYKE